MKTIKWGIIGTGKIARRFASDLSYAEGAQLSGVFSRNPENVQKFSEEFKANPHLTIETLLNSDIDVIYVATPHPSHKEHTILSMRAGKAVLCEKPLAMNAEEVQEMISEARKNDVFFMEGMWTRFFPVIEEVKTLIRNDAIGKILSIESAFGYSAPFDPDSRIFNRALGGGSLLDVGVYSVAFAHMIIGETGKVTECEGVLAGTGVDESARWKLVYPSGAIANGESSVVKILSNEAKIKGTKGEIRIPQFWCPMEYSINGQKKSFDFPGRGFQFEADAVMNCLRKGILEEPRMTHLQSLEVMKILDHLNLRIQPN